MNSISFNGSSDLIRDFFDRFLESSDEIFEPLEETSEKYGARLRALADSRGVDIVCLEKVIDFLVACDLPEGGIEEVLEGDDPWVLTLARDVETLDTYLSDGTIVDVRITDEN